ncbi:hypothetical protein [Fictibacillus nanhaiensis]|uniref:hypothetical protein n=1 Tax=Fictibacillus nanhaiensis TaxID=742169 RepID=UPI003C1F31D3
MNIVEHLSQFQGVIGAIVGFTLSYFFGKTGKIKIFQRNSWLSSNDDGRERKLRKEKEEKLYTTDYYYQSSQHYTLNFELLFFNNSTANKVLTDFSLEVSSINNAKLIGLLLIDLNKLDSGDEAEKLYLSHPSETECFHILSLKPGEAQIIKFISFIDIDHVKENGRPVKVQMVYQRPEKKVMKKKKMNIDVPFY